MTGRETTITAIVRRSIEQSYGRLVAHEAELRAGDDPEAVHQARVATRRLRSDLRTFLPFLDDTWATDLRTDLQWLGSELGVVRDLEVQRDRLRFHAGALPTSDAEAARRVVRRLDADRTAAKADLIAMLDDCRYAQLRTKLASAAETPAFSAAACQPAPRALRTVVRHRWKQIRRAVDELDTDPPDHALHAIRVRAKKCRYAAEACAPALGKPARRFARAMAGLQDVLGEHHDAVVAVAWLAKTAPECSPVEAYAVGMLAQIEREAAGAARAEFPGAWHRAGAKSVHAWL